MNLRRKKWSTFIDKDEGKVGCEREMANAMRAGRCVGGEIAKGGGKGRERGDGHDGRFNGQTMACKTVRF